MFAELYRASGILGNIHYWRTRHGLEVDFIFQYNKKISAIEVKQQAMQKPILPRALCDFIDLYQPTQALVVNSNLSTTKKYNGIEVYWCKPAELKKLL